MELVSVVIPNYNNAHFLQDTIKSVLYQTYPIHEVIICDDGSDDNSKAVVESFGEERVKWIDCGRNGRPAIPRNMGIKAATGNWIAFLDSDDTWINDKIEKQLIKATAFNSEALCCNAYRLRSEYPVEAYHSNLTSGTIGFEKILLQNPVICSTAIVKAEVLKKLPGFPVAKKFRAIEDYALWLKIATCTDWWYDNEPMINYSDNPSQSIRKDQNSEFTVKFRICREYLAWNRLRFKAEFMATVSYTFRLLIHQLRAGTAKKSRA